ncbi:TetR/AcrR family transcriptional regulator [Streptomyces himalayensis]|uniref:TetR/AcrR family transcriptional regulator n=1 Tax=Streptomyces himalayensis TaxID=2820085 RepID=UPI002867C57F|nr:helix-turn-helix domain-containing protein [Streptomyces himalayensis]
MSDHMPARRRDAARSRELLLQAASELFAERGFDRTTVREIGERAGVDAALIARYFGNKTQLYVATLQNATGDAVPTDLLDPDRLLELLERVDLRGPGPITQVAVQPHSDPAAQDAARAALHARLVEPLLERFTREGLDRPRLRAEIVVAAFIGVLLGRRSGAFDELGRAESGDLVTLLRDTLAGEG